jgi:REP element-mobilizing transposase RayT
MTTSTAHNKRLHPSAYGGVLRKKLSGRGARTLSTRFSMHLVLRSSAAKGAWSFVRPSNRHMVNQVLAKQAERSGVTILGIGNAGNHLHLRVKFSNHKQYFKFIRAVAGEIALKIKRIPNPHSRKKNFWDERPFSSIVATAKYVNRLTDYIKINHLEGQGFVRAFARLVVEKWRDGSWPEFEGGVLIVKG